MPLNNYKKQFKDKKITIMGLGLLGRGLGYTKFLAECGADLVVTDLKTKEQLATSVKALSKFKNIKFVLGEHRLDDFKNRDMIIKAAGVPFDSIYINEAKKNNIPVEMDVSLFAKCSPEVVVIGVTGTRGKSMTTTLIYEILKANEKFLKRNVYVGGNLRGVATLPLLKKVKDGDILVCELDSWQLQGFGESKLSPDISVFTTFMPDHMNYYKDSMERYFDDKANIFKYQIEGDVLIVRPDMKKLIPKDIESKLIVVNKKDVLDWKFNVPGEHHRENLACAVAVAKILDIPETKIKKAVANFKDLEGRLQLLKVYKGVKIYNDNNATTPEATIAGIEALKYTQSPHVRHVGTSHMSDVWVNRKIILVCGGADKKLDLTNFVKIVNKYCKAVVLIPGTGTDILLNNYKLKVPKQTGKNLKDVIKTALGLAYRGDIILFSPAFASFGMFNNEYERNDLFMKIVKKLK
ncbi:MAG: UDP-N-acetylmuramoyl-L-alanine--D-glutamate ligase [Minisyncoccia bacterium]